MSYKAFKEFMMGLLSKITKLQSFTVRGGGGGG